MAEWFERWFGEDYLRLYPHRDDADAARAVQLVNEVAPLAGRRVLDLACGPGRHAERLRDHGALVAGLDLSAPLLARARLRLGPGAPLVRADMRNIPFAPESFEVVVNLFTSFGYFANDAQHLCVLTDVARILKAGGRLVLDYLNAVHVRSGLVPHEELVVGSERVLIDRRLTDDGRFVEKEMHLVDDNRRFVERVRLFTPDDLRRLASEAGLTVQATLGDYDGGAWHAAAPRAILVATAGS